VRALVFDGREKAVFNSSSLTHGFSADHDFVRMRPEARFDRNIVDLGDGSGVTYIRLAIKDSEVRASLRLKLIEQLRIQPISQTRYLHPDNTAEYRIVDGSSDIQVATNVSHVAQWTHNKGQRRITFSPQKVGPLLIEAVDLGVELQTEAQATLIVSDIERIEIAGGGLIEIGDKCNVTVRVFDSQGHQFDRAQLRFMNLEPQFTAGTSKERAEGLKVKRVEDDVFEVTGAKASLYRFTVVATRKDEDRTKVLSNMVKIEVFPRVSLNPGSVLIYPGCRWTIQVEGGPETQTKSSIRRQFSIADSSIASIDEAGEVTGKRVGETTLTLKLFKRG
jgi:hypothetical protein